VELQNYLWCDGHFSGAPIERLPVAGNELNCDSRYRGIIGQLDAMIEMLQCYRVLRNQEEQLGRLLQVMRHHVSCENAGMRLVGYPETTAHCLQHRSICVSAAMLGHVLGKSTQLSQDELLELRRLWLEHIQVHDRAFTEFLIS
jgi:hemerythrin